MFNPEMLDMLVCPITRSPLHYDVVLQCLISTQGGHKYPIIKGIPMLVHEEKIQEERE